MTDTEATMKRRNRSFHRLLCALTLLLVLSLSLSLAACGNDDNVTPPNDQNGGTTPAPGDNTTDTGNTDTPGGDTGDNGDNTGDDSGKDDGCNTPGGDDSDSGIPKQDVDPDGKDFGGLQPF